MKKKNTIRLFPFYAFQVVVIALAAFTTALYSVIFLIAAACVYLFAHYQSPTVKDTVALCAIIVGTVISGYWAQSMLRRLSQRFTMINDQIRLARAFNRYAKLGDENDYQKDV